MSRSSTAEAGFHGTVRGTPKGAVKLTESALASLLLVAGRRG
jgi:hypothetical protein